MQRLLCCSRPVYLRAVHDETQTGANWRQIHSSLGIGVPSGHLSTALSRKSRTDMAFATCSTVECLRSSTAAPTSSSRYSLAFYQKMSNFDCLPLKWSRTCRSYTKDGSSSLNNAVTLSSTSDSARYADAEQSNAKSLYKCRRTDFLVDDITSHTSLSSWFACGTGGYPP